MLYLYTWPLEPLQVRRFNLYSGSCSEHLVLLALPLEAEGLVDPEFSDDGKEGRADGNAADSCVRPPMSWVEEAGWRGLPENDD